LGDVVHTFTDKLKTIQHLCKMHSRVSIYATYACYDIAMSCSKQIHDTPVSKTLF